MPFASEGLQEEALTYVNNAFKTYSDRSGLEDNWEKWDKLFNSIPTTKFYQGTADLFPPDTRRACKTLVNFIDEALWGTDPPFKVKGTGGEGDFKKAEVITDTVGVQISQIGMRAKVRRMIWSLVKMGMAVVKVPWKVKKRSILNNRKQRDLMKKIMAGEQIDEKIVKKLITDFDNIDFQPKELRQMFFDPYTPWEDQVCIIERMEVSFDHLKKLEKRKDAAGVESGIYHDVDRVKEGTDRDPSKKGIVAQTVEKVKNATGYGKDQERFDHISEITGLSNTSFNISKDKHELLEAWCEFDIDGDGLNEECVIVIVDRKYVIRLEPNPYDIQEKPFLSVTWELIEGTCLGQGIPQLCERSQIALNDFVNQIMDNITQILNNMWIVDDLAEIPDNQLKSRANGVIHSKAGVDGVKAVEKQLTANEGLKAVAMVKDDIKNISGATASIQGLPTKFGTTLGEVNQQATSSARDIFAVMREIEDRVIKPFLRKAWSYDLQFMSREDFMRLVGKEAAESSIGSKSVGEALGGEFDFIPQGVSQLESKVVKTQQYINFLNIVAKIPPGIVNLPKLIQKIWKPIGDGDDITMPQIEAILIAPEDENILVSQGVPIQAKENENHQLHIQTHLRGDQTKEMLEHIGLHQRMMAAAQAPQLAPGGAPPQEQPLGTDIPTDLPPGPQGPPAGVPQPVTPENIGGVALRTAQ